MGVLPNKKRNSSKTNKLNIVCNSIKYNVFETLSLHLNINTKQLT